MFFKKRCTRKQCGSSVVVQNIIDFPPSAAGVLSSPSSLLELPLKDLGQSFCFEGSGIS